MNTLNTTVMVFSDNYLVLTLDVTNKTGLLQDAVLAFKVFNGTNFTDYNGSLPVRNFNMSAANATLSMTNGTIANNIINGFEAKEGNYTISATVDGQSVTYNGVASIGKGIIEVNETEQQLREIVLTSKKKLIERKVDRLVFNVENSIAANGSNLKFVKQLGFKDVVCHLYFYLYLTALAGKIGGGYFFIIKIVFN